MKTRTTSSRRATQHAQSSALSAIGRVLVAGLLSGGIANAWAQTPAADPRLREIVYDPTAVVTLPTRRGEVTLITLAHDEQITELAAGLGADCARPEAPWCIAAQPGGRHVFVKPKSSALAPNNLAIVTDKRTHSIRLAVLADNDPKPPVYRLNIRPPAPAIPAASLAAALPTAASSQADANAAALRTASAQLLQALRTLKTPAQQLDERMQARPQVHNTQYSVAEGPSSQDIVPTLVFDDGRFTYLKFPGNREVPAVFQVQGDGSEALLNTHMDDDLLVIDRVSRRLVLRAGQAVVNLHNEQFDIDGVAPEGGTTVPGVQRLLRTPGTTPATPAAIRAPMPAGMPGALPGSSTAPRMQAGTTP